MGETDVQRLFTKLDTHGAQLARIEERTDNTNERMTNVETKLDQMRSGEWECPTGRGLTDKLRTHTHHDGSTVVKKKEGPSLKQIGAAIGIIVVSAAAIVGFVAAVLKAVASAV